MEIRRAALRQAAAPPNGSGQVMMLPYTMEEILAPPEVLLPVRKFDDREASQRYLHGQGSVAAIYPFKPGTATVLLEPDLRAAFQSMREKTRHLLPDWAAVNVQAVPSILIRYGPPPPANLGTYIPDVLSRQNLGHYVIETGPRERGWLLRDYYQLLFWAIGLIGAALVTALIGLNLVHRTLDKERRLGEMKSQFVSSVSHELRAPVGSLRLMADGLASGKVSGAAADEFHRLMAGEGARLSSLIENVLDFARIEEGRKEYHFAETDVAALVQDAVKLMTPLAEARGLKIETTLDPLPFVPKVDAGALQQALINLLDNAIKFAPSTVARASCPQPANDENSFGQDARATVEVSLAADPSRNAWSLTVTDHGPGIPREEHARIFERFYRLGNELRRETTGTGIGLAIVKHVVEGHGGRVYVKSEIGNGSEFRMEFPGAQFSVPCGQSPTPGTGH